MGKKSKKSSESAAGVAVLELPSSSPQRPPGRIELIGIERIGVTSNTRLESKDDQAGLRELAASMAAGGMHEPIGVLQNDQGSYVVVFGHRRLAAAKLLKWDTIEARIYPSSADVDEARAVENVQRAELNPIERTMAVGAMMDKEMDRIRQEAGLADDQEPDAVQANEMRQMAIHAVAEKIGKTASWVRDHVFLATLDKTTRELVHAGKLPWKYARELAKIADPGIRADMARRASVGYAYGHREFPMAEREFKAMIAGQLHSLGSVPWKLDIEFAGGPPCNTCECNSANKTGLFEHVAPMQGNGSRFSAAAFKEPENGVCLNRECFSRKSSMANRQITNAAKKVALTVSAAPKKERDDVRKEAVKAAEAKASVVRPEVLRRQVKERESTAGVAEKNKTKMRTSTAAPKPRTPEDVAKEKLYAAEQARLGKLADGINKTLKDGGREWLLLKTIELLAVSNEWRRSPKAKKRLVELADLAAGGSEGAFRDLADEKPAKWNSDLERYDWPPEAIEGIAKKLLGADQIPPMPKLEDFLPKAADKPAAVAPEKSNRKAKKKGKPAKADEPCVICGDPANLESDNGDPICDTCAASQGDMDDYDAGEDDLEEED